MLEMLYAGVTGSVMHTLIEAGLNLIHGCTSRDWRGSGVPGHPAISVT